MSAILSQPAMQLRAITVDDLDAIMAIEEQAYPFPWTRGIFADCVRVGYGCWLMESEETLLGYGVLSWGPEEAHLLNLTIAPRYQGNGYGRTLIRSLIERAIVWGAKTLFLEVRPSNVAAVNLYRSLGFNEVGLRPDYYPSDRGREDALVMALVLEDWG